MALLAISLACGTQPAMAESDPPPPTPSSRSIAPACTFEEDFEDGFADVPPSTPHETAIDCVVYWQLTTGLRPGVYNPSGSLTREQMASFVGRFILKSGGTLPASPPDAFTDDETSAHEGAINKLAAVGIVTGRADGTYAPRAVVTRAQMATFLVRGLEYRIDAPLIEAAAPNYFTDDDGDVHEANINKAAAIGITGGTGGTSYGPSQPVRRDQMASFLARPLAEVVDRGLSEIPSPPPKCGLDPAIEQTDAGCKPCPYDASISASNSACQAPAPLPPAGALTMTAPTNARQNGTIKVESVSPCPAAPGGYVRYASVILESDGGNQSAPGPYPWQSTGFVETAADGSWTSNVHVPGSNLNFAMATGPATLTALCGAYPPGDVFKRVITGTYVARKVNVVA